MLLQRATAQHRALSFVHHRCYKSSIIPVQTASPPDTPSVSPVQGLFNPLTRSSSVGTRKFHHRTAAMGSSTASPGAKISSEIPQVPADCEQEEQLLQALTSIPQITKAIARANGQRVDISVSHSGFKSGVCIVIHASRLHAVVADTVWDLAMCVCLRGCAAVNSALHSCSHLPQTFF